MIYEFCNVSAMGFAGEAVVAESAAPKRFTKIHYNDYN